MEDLQPNTPVVITSDASYAATGVYGIIGTDARYGSAYPIIFPGLDSAVDWYDRDEFEVVTEDHADGLPSTAKLEALANRPSPWEPIPGDATVNYRDTL